MRTPTRPWSRILWSFAVIAVASCGGGGGGGDGGVYTVQLRYPSTLTTTQKAAFEAAAARLERIVTLGLGSVPITWDAEAREACEVGQADVPSSENLRNLVIFVSVLDLGSSGVIAESGPCLIRDKTKLPVAGVMLFDTEYTRQLERAGKLDVVVLHEMLHVLGLGTQWGAPTSENPGGRNLLVGEGGSDVEYKGAGALAAARDRNGAPGGWTTVPVENCVRVPVSSGSCGAGTRDSHWRWSVFASASEAELMTGWVGEEESNPLSAMSIAALADLGYEVDLSAADEYTIPSSAALQAMEAPRSGSGFGFFLGDDVRRTPPLVVPTPPGP